MKSFYKFFLIVILIINAFTNAADFNMSDRDDSVKSEYSEDEYVQSSEIERIKLVNYFYNEFRIQFETIENCIAFFKFLNREDQRTCFCHIVLAMWKIVKFKQIFQNNSLKFYDVENYFSKNYRIWIEYLKIKDDIIKYNFEFYNEFEKIFSTFKLQS